MKPEYILTRLVCLPWAVAGIGSEKRAGALARKSGPGPPRPFPADPLALHRLPPLRPHPLPLFPRFARAQWLHFQKKKFRKHFRESGSIPRFCSGKHTEESCRFFFCRDFSTMWKVRWKWQRFMLKASGFRSDAACVAGRHRCCFCLPIPRHGVADTCQHRERARGHRALLAGGFQPPICASATDLRKPNRVPAAGGEGQRLPLCLWPNPR